MEFKLGKEGNKFKVGLTRMCLDFKSLPEGKSHWSEKTCVTGMQKKKKVLNSWKIWSQI